MDATGTGTSLRVRLDTKLHIIGDELSGGQESIEDGVAAVANIEDWGVFECGAAVAPVGGDGGEAGKDVDFCECFSGAQKLGDRECDLVTESVEEV